MRKSHKHNTNKPFSRLLIKKRNCTNRYLPLDYRRKKRYFYLQLPHPIIIHLYIDPSIMQNALKRLILGHFAVLWCIVLKV